MFIDEAIKMIQDQEVNKELNDMAIKIWDYIGKDKKIPKIETKQGGSSSAYYSDEHIVRIRSNVWKKLSLGGKRMLLIHELINATGTNYGAMLHGVDLRTLNLYLMIYGQDGAYYDMLKEIKKLLAEHLVTELRS